MSVAMLDLRGTTFDVYLNCQAFWRNVAASVRTHRLSGYQVLKKWLSYRKRAILGRPLQTEASTLPIPRGGSR